MKLLKIKRFSIIVLFLLTGIQIFSIFMVIFKSRKFIEADEQGEISSENISPMLVNSSSITPGVQSRRNPGIKQEHRNIDDNLDTGQIVNPQKGNRLKLADAYRITVIDSYKPTKRIDCSMRGGGNAHFAINNSLNSSSTCVEYDISEIEPLNQSVVLSQREAQFQVMEQLKTTIVPNSRSSLPLSGQEMLLRTQRNNKSYQTVKNSNGERTLTSAEPFTSIVVRSIPENITIATLDTLRTDSIVEKIVFLREGRKLDEILIANGVKKERAAAVMAAFNDKKRKPIRASCWIRLLFADFDGSGTNLQLARVTAYLENKVIWIVAATDNGTFVITPHN